MARLISRNMSATDSPLLEVDSCLLLALTLVSTASLCVSSVRRDTGHHNFLGRLSQGCSLLFGRIGWTDQLQRESS